jgi:hypothetical protein
MVSPALQMGVPDFPGEWNYIRDTGFQPVLVVLY